MKIERPTEVEIGASAMLMGIILLLVVALVSGACASDDGAISTTSEDPGPRYTEFTGTDERRGAWSTFLSVVTVEGIECVIARGAEGVGVSCDWAGAQR